MEDKHTSLRAIAAPAQMWTEVPESLLPHYDVPASGVLTLVAGPGEIGIRVVGQSTGTWWIRTHAGAAPRELIPVRALTRRIKIVGDDGKPLSSAGVSVMATVAPGTSRVVAQYSADRYGDVVFPSIPDLEPLTVVMSDPNFVPQAFTVRIAQLPARIQMLAGHSVSGRFVDRQNHAIPDVGVRIEGWLGSTAAIALRKTKSAADGKWAASQLPSRQRFVMAATHVGYAPVRMDLNVGDQSIDLGSIVMERGSTLHIRTIDDITGKPVAGVQIDASLGRTARTDSRGVADIDDVSMDSPIELKASREGFILSRASLTPPYRKENSVRMTRAFTVRGIWAGAPGRANDASVRISEDTSFREEPVERDFSLALSPDVTAQLEFRSTSTGVVKRTVKGGRGETLDLGTIAPPTGSIVRGRVLADSALPASGASVWAIRDNVGGPLLGWLTGDVLRTEADADGNFELAGLGSERALLRIEAPGYARTLLPIAIDPSIGSLDVGDVELSQGTSVRIVDRNASDATASVSSSGTAEDVDAMSAPIVDGVATIDHIPSGRAIVTVRSGHITLCERQIRVSSQTEPLEIDCSTSSTTVRGTVLIGSSHATGGTLTWASSLTVPVAGVIMNRATALGASQQDAHGGADNVATIVDSEGKFETTSLHPGVWQVRWYGPESGSTAPKSVEIADSPEADVILQYSSAVVAGTVVDTNGLPVPHAVVKDVDGEGAAVTLADGTFRMAGLTPGSHKLKARLGALVSDTTTVILDDGRDAAPLRLVVSERNSDVLPIQVMLGDGEPAENAFVFVETASGALSIVTTGLDGRSEVRFTDEHPQLRCAALTSGGWVFGPWTPPEAWKEGMNLHVGGVGALLLSGAKKESSISVATADAWDVSALQSRVGLALSILPGKSSLIRGLPAGTYSVTSDGATVTVEVKPGKVREVHLSE